jgi:hypothetical protein
MTSPVRNQSKVVVKDGVLTITTWCGEVHTMPVPGLRDFEQVADPNDPNAMFIEDVKIQPRHQPQ